MADTKAQSEAEFWIRRTALPNLYGQSFTKRSLHLTSGGEFSFDAVSDDGKIVAVISTSAGKTASGNPATAKLLKMHSDAYWFFLLDHQPERKIFVFTDQSMIDLLQDEKKKGRFPKEFELLKIPLPPELAAKVAESQKVASEEVSPKKNQN